MVEAPRGDPLSAVEERLGHRFRDRRLLAQALTHSSFHREDQPSNERLEFLGDSLLGAIVARHLYVRFPHWDEGQLTRVKSAIVSAATLAEAARSLGLERFSVVGKGMATKERLPTSVLANIFEAIVAAIYLDSGEPEAERFVLSALAPKVREVIDEGLSRNWKSILQEFAQKAFAETPTYRVTREEGPEHMKQFEVVARLGEREFGRGSGLSKKEAEQRAAEATLRALLGPLADMAREGAGAELARLLPQFPADAGASLGELAPPVPPAPRRSQ